LRRSEKIPLGPTDELSDEIKVFLAERNKHHRSK
jgi:hypothetical protein